LSELQFMGLAGGLWQGHCRCRHSHACVRREFARDHESLRAFSGCLRCGSWDLPDGLWRGPYLCRMSLMRVGRELLPGTFLACVLH